MSVAPRGSSRPIVFVNLTWLVPGVVGGSEDSVTDSLRAMAADPPHDVEVHLAVLEPFLTAHPDLAGSFPCRVLRLDGRDKVWRVLAEQTWLARETRRIGAEVVHHAGGVVPLVHPGRVVLTIHDLQPLDLPENFSFAKRTYIKAMVRRSAAAATGVLVPSEFTRGRVVELLGVDPERIDVVPWFVRSAEHTTAGDGGTPQEVPDGPFLLYPAITYPHKNHLTLLEAFARLARDEPEVRLVLAGGEGSVEDQVRERIAAPDLRGRVLRTGRVARPTLEALYAACAGVVVPSRYEGFGLPVLEAMTRGCPVVVARAGSLPEVARPEDLVDPDDVTGWRDAMQCVLDLPGSERSERVRAGRDLAARFTPGSTAEGLLRSYRRALPLDAHP